MRKSFYTTILFDFDGTLTPSLPLWREAYQYALSQFGINLSQEEVVRSCFYRSWKDIVAQFGINSIDEFRAHVRTGLENAFIHAVPFKGVIEFLEECSGRSVKMGIVTSTTKNFVSKFFESHNMEKYFQAIVTADDISNHKPHPEPVLLALDLLKSKAEDSLIIGDSSVDLLAGHAAGVERGLFFPHEHSVFYDYHELNSHEPHFVFHDYMELKERLLALK